MAEQYATPSNEFLAALGALTLNWASIDAALDFTAATVFHQLRNPKMDKEIPQALGRKIEFLKQALRHDLLAPIRDPAKALLAQIKEHRDERHSLVHGAILGAAHGDEIEFLRITYEKTRHITGTWKVTTAEINRRAERAFALSHPATAFSIRVFNIANPREAIDYPLGEFGT